MCFSIAIDKDIKKLSKIFDASISEDDFKNLQKIFTQQDKMDQGKFEYLLGIPHSPKRPTVFRMPREDNRVFPGYFANVIVMEQGKKIFRPMRYRIRPEGSSEEIPDKFGVYNARLDSLELKKTWKPLFMRKHGLVPFTNFYEWVLDPEEKKDLGLFSFLDEEEQKALGDNPKAKKRLISFYPNRDIMWAPCLWDEWTSPNGEMSFRSFAIITDEPPREVEIMGHDRCPIFIKHECIDSWLRPELSTKFEILECLKQKEDATFSYKWSY